MLTCERRRCCGCRHRSSPDILGPLVAHLLAKAKDIGEKLTERSLPDDDWTRMKLPTSLEGVASDSAGTGCHGPDARYAQRLNNVITQQQTVVTSSTRQVECNVGSTAGPALWELARVKEFDGDDDKLLA